jgi:hypothetical protein
VIELEFEGAGLSLRCDGWVALVLSFVCLRRFARRRTQLAAREEASARLPPVVPQIGQPDRLREALDDFLSGHRGDLPPHTYAALRQILRRAKAAEQGPAGKIISPAWGDRVGQDISVRVELADIPEGYYVWLAVEAGGWFWPQGPDIPRHVERWQGALRAKAGQQAVGLSLWLVPPCCHLRLRDWCARSARESCTGLTDLPGAVRLDAVRGLTIFH